MSPNTPYMIDNIKIKYHFSFQLLLDDMHTDALIDDVLVPDDHYYGHL